MSARAIAIAAVAAAMAVLGNLVPPYDAELLSQVLIYGIFAMSLDLLLGYTGLPSLGHAAYFGVAAYGMAILTLQASLGVGLAALLGLAAAVIAAAVFNLLALRTAAAYYLMITLAFAEVLYSLAQSWTALTGGENGLSGAWRPAFALSSRGYFDFVLVVFALVASLLALFVASPVGYALRGIRENEHRMRALGYPVWRYKYLVSVVAALFAGIAGELYLGLANFIGPSVLSITLSAQVLMMILVGAAGTLFGPVIGAAAFVFLQYVLSSYTERWLFVVGLIYVFVALYAPKGVLLFALDRFHARRPVAR